MKISELGEFGLIDILAGMTYAVREGEREAWRQLLIGIGDDAAAWQGDGSVQLVTTDLLVEGVHFSLDTTSWDELGWRAMAANLSDIGAMGGSPRYAVVSLAMPGHTEVEDIVALYRGMIELAQKFGVAMIGGDTSSAAQLVINIALLGVAEGREILTRSAARPGERVAVTGLLGASAAGLEMLSKRLVFDAASNSALREAFLKPYPRVVEGQVLVGQGVRAAIDISDGLIADLGHICRMSKVGARLEEDKVPVHPAVRANFGDRAMKLALSGGEDYELIFTAGEEIIDRVKAALSCPVTVIGEVVADESAGITLLDGEGRPVELTGTGWEHFTG